MSAAAISMHMKMPAAMEKPSHHRRLGGADGGSSPPASGGSEITLGSSVSTSTITTLAALVAAAAVVSLAVAGRKPARRNPRTPRAPADMLDGRVVTEPSLLEPPVRWWQRLRAVVGTLAIASAWGLLLAVVVAAAVTGAVLILGHAVR